MTSLIEFVEARLDEDEAIARAAYGKTEQDWTVDTDPDLPAKHVQGRPSIKTSGMGWQTTSGDGIWSCDDPEDECRIYRREDKADAEHIVHFAPARVLREVKAKRAIIEAVKGLSGQMYDYVEYKVLTSLADTWRDHPDHPGTWNYDENEDE